MSDEQEVMFNEEGTETSPEYDDAFDEAADLKEGESLPPADPEQEAEPETDAESQKDEQAEPEQKEKEEPNTEAEPEAKATSKHGPPATTTTQSAPPQPPRSEQKLPEPEPFSWEKSLPETVMIGGKEVKTKDAISELDPESLGAVLGIVQSFAGNIQQQVAKQEAVLTQLREEYQAVQAERQQAAFMQEVAQTHPDVYDILNKDNRKEFDAFFNALPPALRTPEAACDVATANYVLAEFKKTRTALAAAGNPKAKRQIDLLANNVRKPAQKQRQHAEEPDKEYEDGFNEATSGE